MIIVSETEKDRDMKFDNAKFENLTGRDPYVFYNHKGERKFVARFMRGGKADFLRFLVKNFTVEEYFDAMEAGNAPLTILETKGYVTPIVKKMLKQHGLPQTQEGFNILLDRQIARRA